MNAQEIIEEIAHRIETHEDALKYHDPKVSEVYFKYRDAFFEGQSNPVAKKWFNEKPLRRNILKQIQHYMLISSYLSAIFHLIGDKDNCDKTTNACVMLVSGLYPNPEMVMEQHVDYERLWRETIKKDRRIPNSRNVIYITIFLILIVSIIVYFLIFS